MTFFENMRSKPVFFIDIPKKERIKHLVDEYADCPKTELIDSVERIAKRLGGKNTQIAIDCIEKNNFEKVADLALTYYDKYYLRGLKNRKFQNNILTLKLDSVNPKLNAEKLKKYYNAI